MKLPTALEILSEIYSCYYTTFSTFSKDSADRSARILVPIDVVAIARRFGVDPDIVFGRPYFHLEEKHGYKRPDGSEVHFFALTAGSDRHCVNFPLLVSVLAGM